MKKCVLLSKKSGKRIVFNSISEAGLFLGRDYGYVQKMKRLKKPLRNRDTGEPYEIVTDLGNNGLTLKDIGADMVACGVPANTQPCGYCKNACGGCTWSRNFTPIKGWKAIPTILDRGNGNKPIHSFKILYCPEFVVG